MPSDRNRIGTLTWARRHGGRLRPVERFAVARASVASLLSRRGRNLLRGLGLGDRRQVSLALSEIPLPDSPVARAAVALCEDVSPPFLANHCHRTYLWGALLAARDGIAFDAELFYVASLLHDLGLCERYAPTGPIDCFALSGALEAERFARREGWPPTRAELLAEAICRHLNPVVRLAEGPEAHLLRQGSGLDVAGFRRGDVAPTSRAEVLERHPRLDQNRELAELLEADAARHPTTRIALHCRLGFSRLVRTARFPS